MSEIYNECHVDLNSDSKAYNLCDLLQEKGLLGIFSNNSQNMKKSEKIWFSLIFLFFTLSEN